MARPIKQGIEYFPLDVNFLKDIKVRKIIKACGVHSPTVLISILSNIYRENGYFIAWDSDMPFLVSDEVGVSEGTVSEIVKKALQVSFFNEDMFKKYNILTSKGIQSRFLRAIERRKQVDMIAEYFLLENTKPATNTILNLINVYVACTETELNGVNVYNNSENVYINQQSKAKESKIKNSNTVGVGKNNISIAEPENNNTNDNVTAKLICLSEDFGYVKAHYEKYYGNLLSNNACIEINDFLTQGVEKTLICRAIDASIDANVRNWKYASAIINDCISSEILTLEKYKIREANRQARKKQKADNQNRSQNANINNKFANFKQRDWDYKEIEKIMEGQFLADMINNK